MMSGTGEGAAMGDIQRGFRIAAVAVRGWRENPLRPFVARGVTGGRRWLRLGVFVGLLAVVAPVAHELLSRLSSLVGVRSMMAFGPAWASLAMLMLSVATGLLSMPLLWSVLLPVVAGAAVRRWMAGEAFHRDVRPIPDAVPSVVGSLLVPLAGVTAVCWVTSSFVHAALNFHVVGPAGAPAPLWYLAQSKLVRTSLFASAMNGGETMPPSLLWLAEGIVRAAGGLRVAAQVAICFAVMVRARTAARGIAGVVGIRMIESAASGIAWTAANMMLAFHLGPSEVPTFAVAGVLAMVDILATPAVAFLWACVACWMVARLHDAVERRLAGDGGA